MNLSRFTLDSPSRLVLPFVTFDKEGGIKVSKISNQTSPLANSVRVNLGSVHPNSEGRQSALNSDQFASPLRSEEEILPYNRSFCITEDEGGYSVWSSWPLKQIKRRKLDGTIASCHPLPLSPLVVLRGGGRNPLYPPNKIVLCDDSDDYDRDFGDDVAGNRREKAKKEILEVEFREDVLGVHVRLNTVIVVLLQAVVWFEYGLRSGRKAGGSRDRSSTAELEDQGSSRHPVIERDPSVLRSQMLDQPKRQGNGASTEIDDFFFEQRGEWQTCPNPKARTRATSQPKSPIIIAHDHDLAAICLTTSGSHVATASTKGTLIRIWDVETGSMTKELRRGVESVDIFGLAFSPELRSNVEEHSHFRKAKVDLACWSDKGSIHIWENALAPDPEPAKKSEIRQRRPSKTPRSTSSNFRSFLTSTATQALNTTTTYLPFTSSLPSYFSARPSTAQYYLPRDAKFNLAPISLSPLNFANLGSEQEREPEFAEMLVPDKTPREMKVAEGYTVAWVDLKAPLPSDENHDDWAFGRPFPTESGWTWPEWQEKFARKVLEPYRPAPPKLGKQLLVVTHTGEYFRLSLPDRSKNAKEGGMDGDALERPDEISEIQEGDEEVPSDDGTASMQKKEGDPNSQIGHDGRDHARKRYRNRCKVEEFRRLETVRDGW